MPPEQDLASALDGIESGVKTAAEIAATAEREPPVSRERIVTHGGPPDPHGRYDGLATRPYLDTRGAADPSRGVPDFTCHRDQPRPKHCDHRRVRPVKQGHAPRRGCNQHRPGSRRTTGTSASRGDPEDGDPEPVGPRPRTCWQTTAGASS